MKKMIPLCLLLMCGCAHFDGFGASIGAEAALMGVLTVRHLQHPSHPSCTISRGPDTVVTKPTPTKELTGERWGNDCLTQDEVRLLRHE